MAYQSLYRRYRPRRFGELRGQEHVVRALRNAVREERVGHAYLFSGPRGTGKTSAARILAKVLNCERPEDGEPCCECDSCLAVEAGTSYDVHELDAASNNGVDAMRDLIEKAMLGTPGRHKVYILDEVHMLSKPAEAALLKTLEEPPSHVVFVLATTDPQKVSSTIVSRTQHLQFHLLPVDELEAHVRWVVQDAGLEVDEGAIDAVLRQGGGSARDTLSALEQVVAAGGLGPDDVPLDDLVEALIARDSGAALAGVATATAAGQSARTLAERLVAHLRDAFLSLFAAELVELPDRQRERVTDQAKRLGPAAAVRALEVLGETLVEFRHAPDPRLLLDVALVRLTNAQADTSIEALLGRIERLERQLAGGGSSTRAAPVEAEEPSARAREPAPPRPSMPKRPAPSAAAPAAPPAVGDAPAAARADTPASGQADATASRGEATAAGRAAATASDRADATASDRADATASDRAGAPASTRTEATAGDRTEAPASGQAEASAGERAEATASSRTGATAGDRTVAPAGERPDPTPRLDQPAPPSVVAEGAASSGGGVPSREQLTLAWGDHVLPRLKGMAKALYSPGRFVEAEGDTAVFALPLNHPLHRCEPLRGEVEAALAGYFGHTVPVRLVLDQGQVAKPPDEPEEPVDPSELVDARPADVPTPVEQLAKAFPGAELLEGEP
jgi:DNA polymerase-3 subunit gamma/tau